MSNITDGNGLVIGTFSNPGVTTKPGPAGNPMVVLSLPDGTIAKVSGTTNGVVFSNNKIKNINE